MAHDIASDFAFARDSGEFDRQAPLLRYVAAINVDLTKADFVKAATAAGFNLNTAAIQFAQSRRFSVSLGDVAMLADGSLIEIGLA